MELKQALDDLKQRRVKYYTILDYPLDSARANEVLSIAGSYLYVLELTGLASIKLNEVSADTIDLFKYRQISSPFYRFFITHGSQAGKVLKIAIGVGSEVFSLQDFQSPDLSAMSAYIQDLRNSYAYNFGTQVAKSGLADNATVILHTVTAGKTLLLEAWSHSFDYGGASQGSLFVRDTGDTTVYTISFLYNRGSASGQLLLAIPEGYDVCLYSFAAAVKVNGFIKGREI